MQNNQQSDRLSWGDTVFLNLEREGMPLNVASVSVFEGDIPFENCIQLVESKLPLVPRYLKRVVPAAFGIGLPTWEYDTEFDLGRHVRQVTLKHGTDTELKAAAAKLFGAVMDRKHPLWDMTFVHGLKQNRTAMIFRLHHCLADGIAGVGIVSTFMDADPDAPKLPKKKLKLRIPEPRDPLSSVAGGVIDSYSDFAKRILSGWEDLLTMAERATANGGSLPSDELARLMPEITATTERLRFNVIYRGPQKFAWADVPLAEVKAIKQAFGASVNDVILALVTATVRRYSELHGDRVKGRLLRIMVPVNLRGQDSAAALGNRISLVPVTVPLDIRNPRKLLLAVHERTEFLKNAHAAEVISLAGGLVGTLPIALQSLVGPMISQVPFTPFNMVCTNVPGPQYPLYLLGHKMLRWYPYVPIGGELAVNCAILSYDGKAYFGFSGDAHAAPDLRRLEGFLKDSFVELRQAAGITTAQAGSPPRKKTARGKTREKPAHAAGKTNGSIPPKVSSPSVEPGNASQPMTDDGKAAPQLIA